MTNTNCLAGMACPKCKSEEPFDIVCTSIYRFYDDGTDYDCSGIEWDENSNCTCRKCGYEEIVDKFTTKG